MTRASSPSSFAVLALGERDRRRVRGRPPPGRALPERQPGLDHERVAAVHRRRPGDRGVELALDLLVEAVEDRLLADGREAVRRRRHDLGRLDGLVERLGVLAVDVARLGVRRELGRLADLLGEGGGHAAEVARQEARERVALRVLEHPQEDAELDAVGMRLDLLRRRRQLVDRPRVLPRLALRRVVDERHVRVGDGRLPRGTRPPRRGPSGSAPRSRASPGCRAGCSQSIFLLSKIRGSFFLVSICTSK